MEHVGDLVEIVVIRADSVTPRHLKLMVAEVEPEKFNRLVFSFLNFKYEVCN